MKVASVCAALAVLLVAVMATDVPDGKPRAKTTLGVVAGQFDATTRTNAWIAVPYAASTEGANRFQPPKERAPWAGEFDATQWGAGCYQYKQNADVPAHQSEDCLHANVYAPKDGKNLPVVVWIHGGGFMEGSNIGPYEVYYGRYFASKTQALLIAINYRLGSLGFLTSGTGAGDIQGNMGFMDQQFALRWVQANAAAFGGDPTKVTLWGESAGAMSIGLHMIAPTSKGLFHRVIQESNPLAILYKTQHDAGVLGRDTCKRVGCADCNLQCMQAVPVDKLMVASKAAAASMWVSIASNYKHILGALLDFTPVIGGVIPSQVIPALANGDFVSVPMITGTNLEEGQTFVFEALKDPLPKLPVELALGAVSLLHGPGMVKRYVQSTDKDGREPLSRAVTDFLFTCPSQQFALAAAQPKKTTVKRQSAWVYQYQHVFSNPTLFKGLIPDRCATAVCHATELPIVFHNGPVIDKKEQPLTPDEQKLSDQIIGYFGNFIRSGNPNPPTGAPTWPVFDPAQRNALVLGGRAAGTTVRFADACKSWDSIGYGVDGALVNALSAMRFRAVDTASEAAEAEDEAEDEMDAADEAEMEADVEDEAEDESEAEMEDEADAESDAELDAEDAADMEDFADDEAEAERYEFADA